MKGLKHCRSRKEKGRVTIAGHKAVDLFHWLCPPSPPSPRLPLFDIHPHPKIHPAVHKTRRVSPDILTLCCQDSSPPGGVLQEGEVGEVVGRKPPGEMFNNHKLVAVNAARGVPSSCLRLTGRLVSLSVHLLVNPAAHS